MHESISENHINAEVNEELEDLSRTYKTAKSSAEWSLPQTRVLRAFSLRARPCIASLAIYC